MRPPKAAYGGLHAAQLRYGAFVVGYYATDEMLWPNDRETAVAALGLLRFAVLLDPKWLSLALEEARAYEACVDKL